jgi:hypothetical protein
VLSASLVALAAVRTQAEAVSTPSASAALAAAAIRVCLLADVGPAVMRDFISPPVVNNGSTSNSVNYTTKKMPRCRRD